MNLTDLHAGQRAIIAHVNGSGALRARLGEMGFVAGQTVKKIYTAPLGNPAVFEILGSKVALRRTEASQILIGPDEAETPSDTPLTFSYLAPSAALESDSKSPVFTVPDRQPACPGCSHGCSDCSGKHRHARRRQNPGRRPGEITLALVGNPNCGKTSLFNAASGGHERTGNYSGVTVRSVIGHMTFEGRPIRLIDLPGTYSLRAFSPEEAYVAHELKNGGIDAVINVLDATNLERNLLLTLQLKERKLPLVGALNMYDELTDSGSELNVDELSKRLNMPFVPTVARQHQGIDKLLREAIRLADNPNREAPVPAACAAPTASADNGTECPCCARENEDKARYATINRLLNGIYTRRQGRAARITSAVDRLLAARWLGYPFFIALMGVIFWATFTLGQYPMDWIDNGVAWLGQLIESRLPQGMVRDLLIDGILGGVGSVIVFLPNILILYFLISILEDSGYLARAALLADPFLNRMGLHGKSFIPMLMGFGCNVPAVMATRTIENNKSRMLTLLILPFMSCSARMPVYIIFTGAFFAAHAGAVMLGLYVLGILTALLAAWIISRLLLQKQETHFVMELPPYRLPSTRGVVRHTWEKGRQYLHKMGGIILVASIVIWALGYFPRQQEEGLTPGQQQEQSYMGRIGHAIEPVLRPLGFDWRMDVGILAGVGAKELMVSSLGVLYGCSEEDAEAENADDASQTRLAKVLAEHTTPQAAISYLVFALLYFPCLATIIAIAGESGSWKYGLLTAAYTTVLAYVMAFAAYRLAFLIL